MEILYKKAYLRNKLLPVWLKVVQDFNKGISVPEMINNPEYVSPRTGQTYKTRASIYYILRRMQTINI